MGMETEHLCCDNAGEHLKEMLALCEEFAMDLELTAPDVPQQNGVVERRFVVLKQRALATMIAADLLKKIWEILWCEAVSCANDLENASASTVRGAATTKASHCKERKLERELKKLDSSWNPSDKTAMDAPVVVETEDHGKEKTTEVHFVFNTQLMMEHGDPKTFKEAVEGPDADLWLRASGNEAMHFVKRESWRKKLCLEVKQEGRKTIGAK
jgi:hypothetical protein